jgi:hypothetical protein
MNINWLSIILQVAIFVLNLILKAIIKTNEVLLGVHKAAVDKLKDVEGERH